MGKRAARTKPVEKPARGSTAAKGELVRRVKPTAPKAPTNHTPKKTRPAKAVNAARPQPAVSTVSRPKKQREAPPEKPILTRLTAEELAEFRESLLAKRKEIVADMGSLKDGTLGSNRQDAAGDLSLMPNHMADLGSDNWEQEFNLGLIENQRQVLREIDEALERIENKTYGVCLGTGKPITKARLRAKPWAKYCIEYARFRERNGLS